MGNTMKGIVLTITFILLAIFTGGHTAPKIIHEQSEHNHRIMMAEARNVTDQLENNPAEKEMYSTFFRHPDARWSIAAQKGDSLTFVRITASKSEADYELWLSTDVYGNEESEFTRASKL